MKVGGVNSFSENDNCIIYTMSSSAFGNYCMVVPKQESNGIKMVVDLNMKSVFDEMMAGKISRDNLIQTIYDEYRLIQSKYESFVLVMPMEEVSIIANAIAGQDKQRLFDETKKIGAITSDIYKRIVESGMDKSRIDQKIVLLEKTENDTKFVEWLKGQMPNFVVGLSYQSLKVVNPFENATGVVNPFLAGTESQSTSDIFGPSNSIFDNNGVSNVQNVEPVVSAKEDIFPSSSNGDFFGNQDNTVEPPKPVEAVSLENSNVGVNEPVKEPSSDVIDNQEAVNAIDKKSGGFANLLILLVILVVVTVVSIELGKFLYQTFGT